MNKIVLYCRSGFEKECGMEITDKAAKLEIFGFINIKERSGYVVFECFQKNDADRLEKELSFNSLIFSRQMFVSGGLIKNLSKKDRITPIISYLDRIIEKGGDLRVEVADTNESKKLMRFCRKFTVPLRTALRKEGILTYYETPKYPVIHIFFVSSNCCYVGYSLSSNNSPFYMGIPHLRLSSNAPSRSSLKLEEAFHTFIPVSEWDKRLANGMYAVDLGACPGGWTYQLVKHDMQVYSVDNGRIAQSLINTGQVTWLRKNGFRFRPDRNDISWLVCDMVEKPAKVSALITRWLRNGWCRETIFNLKLPMKERYKEVLKNLEYIQKQLDHRGVKVEIKARQLYHDREEITVHIRLLSLEY